jgi:large subunit ribosomal protein L6
MSKIGKTPINLKSGINVTVQGQKVTVAGPKGQMEYTLPQGQKIVIEEGKVTVQADNINDRSQRALYGLTRANIANLIKGVDTGFEKKLELVGVGYKAQMQGTDLVLSLGFAHPVKFAPKQGIKIAVVDNAVVISGTDKMLVGETAAKIRGIKPPEPYKGKGIKYSGEKIRRKAGKAAKAAGAK